MSVSHGRSRPIDFDGVSFAYAFAMLMVLNVKESVNVWLLEMGSFELPLASLKPISSSSDGFTKAEAQPEALADAIVVALAEERLVAHADVAERRDPADPRRQRR